MFGAAAVWQVNISRLLHLSLPWPLHDGLLVKHALLVVVACFAVEQASGQSWRMFVTGVSGKVSLIWYVFHWRTAAHKIHCIYQDEGEVECC